ncbi:palmitoyltransferase ZDHHC3-like [Balaenoptera musculus]|uniref:Palmitoyltransferase n=1 Tax=Balaenoptera musculus TaxID=9771 RepID=A0A8B8YLR4_BALMU|nr:palmitoyltransferase ZDHHC3-like [Balaenoptera musculus]
MTCRRRFIDCDKRLVWCCTNPTSAQRFSNKRPGHQNTAGVSGQSKVERGREDGGLRTRGPAGLAPPNSGPAPRAPRVWFVLDALGLVCAAATWLLVPSEGAMLPSAWLLPARRPAHGAVHGWLFHLLAFLALAAHARTVLTDAGALPPLGAHHRGVCQRCSRRMDHRCPWVNSCVGEDNRKLFVLFTLRTALAGLHLLLLRPGPARLCTRGVGPAEHREAPGLARLPLHGGAEWLPLGRRDVTIQTRSILTDRTRTEQPQRETAGPGRASPWMNLKAVLGHRPSPAWINPFASPEVRAASEPHSVV